MKHKNEIKMFSIFLLIWALIFGTLVRLVTIKGSEYPLNDGGLFYVMANDLVDNEFKLPSFTSFNQDSIPFAYPPLGLYIVGFLSKFAPPLQVIRILPLIYGILFIIAFYLLANKIFQDNFKAAIATVSFALMPSSSSILIQGGGVTRALGYLCMLLTLYFAVNMFSSSKVRYLVGTSFFGAGVILSHPSASFITVIYAVLFFYHFRKSPGNTKKAILSALFILLLTAPWWVTNLNRHGIEIFQNAFGSGWYTSNIIVPYLQLSTTQERFMTLIMVLSIIGMTHLISKKQGFLTLWFLASLLSQRDGAIYASVPVALLSAVGLIEVILRGTTGKLFDSEQEVEDRYLKLLSQNGPRLIVAFFLLYNILNAFTASFQFSNITITPQENEAIEWVSVNTPADSKFIILSFGHSLNTPLQEWFPTITGRKNVLTVQGYEWVGPEEIMNRGQVFQKFQVCLTKTIDCVETLAKSNNLEYDFILIHSGYVGEKIWREYELHFGEWMLLDLQGRDDYKRIYQTELIAIYERLR